MSTIDELRKKKMQNYLAQQQNPNMQQQMAEEQQARQIQAEIKKVMTTLLSKEAQERISNIRTVKPDLAIQVEIYLLQMFQAGRLRPVVTDVQLKAMLDQMIQKKETKIIRK